MSRSDPRRLNQATSSCTASNCNSYDPRFDGAVTTMPMRTVWPGANDAGSSCRTANSGQSRPRCAHQRWLSRTANCPPVYCGAEFAAGQARSPAFVISMAIGNVRPGVTRAGTMGSLQRICIASGGNPIVAGGAAVCFGGGDSAGRRPHPPISAINATAASGASFNGAP